MTLFRKISTCLFILGITLGVTAAPGAVAPAASKRRTFINKLNLFVTQVQRGFDSIGESIGALKDDVNRHRDMIAKLPLQKLNSSVRYLDSLSPECPSGWTKRFRRCFKFHKCAKSCSANDVKQHCEAEGGHLSSVLSPAEQSFFVDSMYKTRNVWLGGNDRANEGTWVWSDGSLIKDGYTNWGANQPDGGNQNCMIVIGAAWSWWDQVCTYKYTTDAGYVCQMAPTYDRPKPSVK